MDEQAPVGPAGGQIAVRQEFGASEYDSGTQRESAAAAVAAQSRAMVEARYVMALRKPRNWDQVRQDVLNECRRPTFAHNKSAYYRKPIGAGVEGLGIRFVEVALRCMRNVLVEASTIFEDDDREIIRVTVTDLENNITYPGDVRVSKTVERSKPADDGTYISVRQNSQGRKTYTVRAGDDDLLNKRLALISKAVRTLGLRIIPGDIQDEAESMIKQVRSNEAAKDPQAARKRALDAFNSINVRAADLRDYVGHDLDQCTPNEWVELKALYDAIAEGEATWAQALEARRAERAPTQSAAGAAQVGENQTAGPVRAAARKPKADAASGGATATAAPETTTVSASSPAPATSPAPAPAQAPAPVPVAAANPRAAATLMATDGERAYVRREVEALGIDLRTALDECGLSSLDTLTADGFIVLREFIAAQKRTGQ